MINRERERDIIREAILRVIEQNEFIKDIKSKIKCSHLSMMKLEKYTQMSAVLLTGKIIFEHDDVEITYEPQVWLGDNILKDVPAWDMREVWRETIQEWLKGVSNE